MIGKLRYTKRWFAYFDLLGFSNLVRNNEIFQVLPLYEIALNALEQKANPKRRNGISYSWFSDTFIIFTKGGSLEEFALIEQVARLFFQKLILNSLPVRGALTFGNLYTHLEKNIFLGEALMDAYEYGEKQNWLGFLITPSACAEIGRSGLPIEERPYYRHIFDPEIILHPENSNVFAYAFNNGSVNGTNPFLDSIRKMKVTAPEKVKIKYENTEKFIEQHLWPKI